MKEENLIISLFIPSFGGGGAERVVVNLANEFVRRGYHIHIVVLDENGPLLKEVSEKCQIINLSTKKVSKSFKSINKYIIKAKPDVLIANLSHLSIMILLASFFVRAKTKYFVVEHNTPSKTSLASNKLSAKLLPFLMYLTYWRADRVIAVSKGVKNDLVKTIPYLRRKVEVIYNPIFSNEIMVRKNEPIDDSWFLSQKAPTIISVGRLTLQKDFVTLLKAFTIVKKEMCAKLVILGEGEERENLEKLAKDLEVLDDVYMPGFVSNPYKYMGKANVFVLSSIYEGFANVLVEALACGIPVVSTDCESGPREILDNGKYGKLVPVGDAEKMAEAIIETLNSDYDPLTGIERAKQFSINDAVNHYMDIIENV